LTRIVIKKVLSEDVERIELFVAHHIPDLTTALVFPVLLLGYMFWVDWRLALVVLAVFAIALGFQTLTMTSNKDVYERWQTALGKMNSSIVEFIKDFFVGRSDSLITFHFDKENSNRRRIFYFFYCCTSLSYSDLTNLTKFEIIKINK
jgi:ATP-binding cassette subfamily B protein